MPDSRSRPWVKRMPANDPATVAASTRTLEEVLDEGYRLHDVTSTQEHLVFTFLNGDCGLRVHLGPDEARSLLPSDLLDRLAQSSEVPPRATIAP